MGDDTGMGEIAPPIAPISTMRLFIMELRPLVTRCIDPEEK